MSKIEQIIAEIEEYVDNCKFQPLSNSKIIVNRVEMEELIDDLKRSVPDEVKKYQKIIANRDAILKDAQDKAEEMIKKANDMTATLVSEHEIMQQAYKEANSIIDNANAQATETINTANAQASVILNQATNESNDMKDAATQYLDGYLANIQKILSSSIDGMQARCGDLLRSLQENLEETTRNRNSLLPVQNPYQAPVQAEDDDIEKTIRIEEPDSVFEEGYAEQIYKSYAESPYEAGLTGYSTVGEAMDSEEAEY